MKLLTYPKPHKLYHKQQAFPPAYRQLRRQNRKLRVFLPACPKPRKLYHKQPQLFFHSNQLNLKVPFFITSIAICLEHFPFLDYIVRYDFKEKKYAQIYYLVTFL